MFSEYLTLFGVVLKITATDTAVTEITRVDTVGESVPNAVTDTAKQQLTEYAEGTRKNFDFPMAPEGTAFQKAVWQILRTIPWGKTWSYGDVAAALGKPKAARAVGGAIGRNPVLIAIPCHRVIGKNGSLTGFSSGLDLKQTLLRWEKVLWERKFG